LCEDLSREAAKLGPPECRVPPDAVVEGFDVVEDLAGEFVAGGPGSAVDELLLRVAKKLSATALS
jgi:hypothetical protein